MVDTLKSLQELVAQHARSHEQKTVIDELRLNRFDHRCESMPETFESSIYVIIQGRKQVLLRHRLLDYQENHYLIMSIDLPVTGRIIEATPDRPYLALSLRLNRALIAELLLRTHETSFENGQACMMGTGLSVLTDSIKEPLIRLLRLLDRPQDIPVMKPLIMKELIFRLLQGDQACVLRQIATPDSNHEPISRAVSWMGRHFSEGFDIKTVAQMAGMSISTFHRHFRLVTHMSPVQYRNHLRLQEARKRMVSEHVDAGTAAFSVGYNSVSQFNREYKRMFGDSPARDSLKLRQDKAS